MVNFILKMIDLILTMMPTSRITSNLSDMSM